MVKTCEKCGIEFASRKSAQRFCSVACSGRGAPRTRPDVECATCHRPFRPKHAHGQRFCSRQCYLNSGEHARETKDGYVYVYVGKDHPHAYPSGQALEHLVVMMGVLGRPVDTQGEAKESVHHVNGVKNDNRPENLELRSGLHPRGAAVSDLVEFAESILRRYAPRMLAAHGIEAPLSPEDAA